MKQPFLVQNLLYNDLKVHFVTIDYNPGTLMNVTLMHTHDFYEFYLLLNGRQQAIVRDHEFPVKDHEFFLVPPGVEHGHQHVSEVHDDGILVRFYLEKSSYTGHSISTADRVLQSLSTTHIRSFSDPRILKMLTVVPETSSIEQLHLRMISWILLLSEIYENDVSVAPKRNSLNTLDESNLIDRVIMTISTSFMTDLSVKSIADTHNISYRHLARIFLSQTGCTLTQAITYHRIRNALRLLRNTSLPVREIAQRCGFHNEGYFTSVFSRFIGQPPTLYRTGVAPSRSWDDILQDFGLFGGHPLFNTTDPWSEQSNLLKT